MGLCQERRKWTEAEDAILRKEVNSQRQGDCLIDWAAVSAKLPRRTNKDCRKRWLKSGNDCRKGTWTKQEDQQLLEAYEKHGPRWTQIAQEIGTRTADQCAKRWQYSLDPNIDRSEWTSSEDDTLFAAVLEGGRSWSHISQTILHGRSATHLKNRYELLCRRRQDRIQPAQQEDLGFQDSGVDSSDVFSINDSSNPYDTDQDRSPGSLDMDSDGISTSLPIGNFSDFEKARMRTTAYDGEPFVSIAQAPDNLSPGDDFDSIFEDLLADQHRSKSFWDAQVNDPMALDAMHYPNGEGKEFDTFATSNLNNSTGCNLPFQPGMNIRSTNCVFTLEEATADKLRLVCDLLIEKGIRFDMRITYNEI